MARRIVLGIKKVQDYLSDAARNQVPFAMSRTLNELAYGAMVRVRADLPRRFTIRRQYVVRGVRYTKSNKRNLEATVLHRDEYMVKQQTGGEHRARVRRLAIPAEVRARKKSRIPLSRRPKNITKKQDVLVFKHSIVQVKKTKRARQANGTGDFERRFKVLYALRESVLLKPRFEFDTQVYQYVLPRYAKTFDKNISIALKSAKRR